VEKKFIEYLIDLVNQNDLDSIEYKSLFKSIKIIKNVSQATISMPSSIHDSGSLTTENSLNNKTEQKDQVKHNIEESQQDDESKYHVVYSPMSGIFYQAPAPDSPPFVKENDQVDAGQVLCIIDAMKMMNEIESDQAGKIVKILVENGDEVSLNQPIFYLQ